MTLAVSASRFWLPTETARCWRVLYTALDGTLWAMHLSLATPSSVIVPVEPGGRVSHGSNTAGKPSAGPWNMSLMLGARNAVEYVPRRLTPPTVRNRPPAFQVTPL